MRQWQRSRRRFIIAFRESTRLLVSATTKKPYAAGFNASAVSRRPRHSLSEYVWRF
jgi:hypothetical protein